MFVDPAFDGFNREIFPLTYVCTTEYIHGIAVAHAPAVDHGVVGLLHPVPALVAVHGVVAAHDRGDLPHADLGAGRQNRDPVDAVAKSYAKGVTDEFVEPVVCDSEGMISDNDSIIFDPPLKKKVTWAYFSVSAMRSWVMPILLRYSPRPLATRFRGKATRTLGMEASYSVVHTYVQPEMSAVEVTDKCVERINSGEYDVIILNFANCDMVGHTGVYEAACKAVSTVDECVGKVVDATSKMGGVSLITADHGNAERMVDTDGSPFTAHTTNLVPFYIVGVFTAVSTPLPR